MSDLNDDGDDVYFFDLDIEPATDYTPEPPYIPPIAEPGHLSTVVQNLISAPLEEGVVPTFLSVLSTYVERETLPPAKHIHILLCLAREPGQPYANEQASPLSLLHKILSIHSASNIAKLLPIPGDPFRSKNPRERHDLWDAHGKIELDVRRRIRSCERDGVFGLLWRDNGLGQIGTRTGRGKRKRRGNSEWYGDEENDEEEEVERVVDNDAWGILEWLMTLWWKDRSANADAKKTQPWCVTSPAFLQMLPRRSRDLQLDDLTLPLAVLRSLGADLAPLECSTRFNITDTLVDLMIVSVQGPSPPFHGPSLPLALLPFLKEAHLDCLSLIILSLDNSSYPETVAHILTLHLEDLGGTRSTRMAIRRKVQSGMTLREAFAAVTASGNSGTSGLSEDGPFDLDLDTARRWGSLKPPSLAYLIFFILPLSPAETLDKAEAEKVRTRMNAVKECLLTVMNVIAWELPNCELVGWALDDPMRVTRLKESLELSMGSGTQAFEDAKNLMINRGLGSMMKLDHGPGRG